MDNISLIANMTTAPNFDDIECSATRHMCQAIWELGLWEFVKNFEDNDSGFMFSRDPHVSMIGSHPLVDQYGHSGASFAFCCRNAQYIAKNGVVAFNRL
jgi:hypothetical protein